MKTLGCLFIALAGWFEATLLVSLLIHLGKCDRFTCVTLGLMLVSMGVTILVHGGAK